MAFTEFYCDPVNGDNLNAGSTPGNPIAVYTSGSLTGYVFTVASGNPVTDGITTGMYASIYPDGTSPATVFVGQIINVTSTTITVSSTIASGTIPTNGSENRSLRVGGAWKGPNDMDTFPFAFIAGTLRNSASQSTRVNLKNNTTYLLNTNIYRNITDSNLVIFNGYTSNLDDSNSITIDGNNNIYSTHFIQIGTSVTNYCNLNNINITNCRHNSGYYSLYIYALGISQNIKCYDIGYHGILSVYNHLQNINLSSWNKQNIGFIHGINISNATLLDSRVYDDVYISLGFSIYAGYGSSIFNTIVNNVSRYGIITNKSVIISNCDVYNLNTNVSYAYAFDTSASIGCIIKNCNAINCNGYGFYGRNLSNQVQLYNCGHYNCSSGRIGGNLSMIEDINPINYSKIPYRDPDNGDFTLIDKQAIGKGYQNWGDTGIVAGYPDVGAISPKYRPIPQIRQ